MAEARRLDEKEGERSRDVRGVRSRNQATDQPERTKQESLRYSLSSLRAVIKRTRSNSQCDHHRDRRRPEITVVSSEPLVRNSWFPGSSVVLPPLSQSSWSSTGLPVSQVIQEKTQEEHISKPTAAPRRINCTTTSATQTDPQGANSTTSASKCSAATPSSAERRSTGKKPQKPPRPLLPKPGDGRPATKSVRAPKRTAEKTASAGTSEQTSQAAQTNHCDSAALHPSASSQSHQYPVPLPRKKLPKQSTAEQSLVRLGENSDSVDVAPEDESSNKYLKELLEIFSTESRCGDKGDIVNQSDKASESKNAVGEMSTNNQGNMQARIKAFESQTEDGNAVEQVKPEPRPRKAAIKPPVAAKPSVALRSSFTASVDDTSQDVSSTYVPEDHIPAARPEPPKRPVGMSIKEELETIHSKGPPIRPRPSLLSRANCVYEEEPSPLPPVPPVKPPKEPPRPNFNINNHNSTAVINDPDPFSSYPSQFQAEPETNMHSNGGSFARQSATRRPTTIRVPSKTLSFSDNFQDSHPPPLPVQKPIGSMNSSLIQRQMSTPILPSQDTSPFGPEPSLPPRKPSMVRTLPPRPPSVKAGPGRPHAPSLQTTGRSVSVPVSPKPQMHGSHGKKPILPPRPNPGHRLYNKYTLELPHGIAEQDYNASSAGELSFKKNEVLLLVEKVDQNIYECQAGEIRGRVHKSCMKVITPLTSDVSPSQTPGSSSGGGQGQKMEVMFDFVPEGPGELCLKAGDIVTMVEPVDSEWYRGTCRGSTGFFPINYVKVLPDSPKTLPERKPKPSTLSGPRCVARFDFQGEHSDELSFREGDMIQLKEYIGQDWAKGQLGVLTGLFPLSFVEVIEDLPPAPSQPQPQPKAIALPGMVAAQSSNAEIPKPAQVSKSNVNWVVALYDYAGKSADDLSFQQGDCILVTEQLSADWSRGSVNGRDGMFPTAFVESTTGQQSTNIPINEAAAPGGRKARALYSFNSDCEEELSLQVGDIITNLESIDDEWVLGDLKGRRAMVPKNYVQMLE
ncbi:SH3 domain-containing protein 19 isoform X2 [Cynoglossus semilaevis]|uniref:SH3 domain-containing protein 19 isoform X2 n=1 Tax=Cynoglossus semilaevis TaxID=244447 RepID=UPI000495A55D|nr:SH3 domain-containing protein 19 isoform X2 [Cynoglossus semilaevis]